MKKKARFITEIALGLLISGAVAWSYLVGHPALKTASLKTYDLLTSFRPPPQKSNVVKIVEIDQNSVNQLGRWPWPRAMVADLIDAVLDYGSDVIGVNILFNEPDQNEGLAEIRRLIGLYNEMVDRQRPAFKRRRIDIRPIEQFVWELEDSLFSLDGDTRLSQSVDEAGNVILPMYFVWGDPQGANLPPLPDYLEREAVKPAADPVVSWPPVRSYDAPISVFGSSVAAVGHTNLVQDLDGTVRRIPPVLAYGNALFPSFGLQLIREYKNLPREDLTMSAPQSVHLRGFDIPIDRDGKTFIEFAGPAGTFDRYSAIDVFLGAVPEDALKGKIVLAGVTAPGATPTFIGPNGELYNGLEIWANHINNILNQRFITRPPWAESAEWAGIALAALIVTFLLPFVRARFAIPIAAVVFAALAGGSFFLMTKQGYWVSPTYGSALLAVGFAVLVGRRLMFTERGKEQVEAEGMETNKMLGLSFQGQGMLDLAFEKFRKCEVDDGMKDVLYNLGLDMERKRMFTKAAAVYEHIGTVDADYRDIKTKIDLLKKAGEGAVFGGIGKKGSDSTVVVEGLGQSTTLGRYEVTKELGRGAMGIVYLGKDPKINRPVAIKTLRFEDEVDEDQAKSIKERFFREAESAGSLTHPNIIRIFDAGEDQDVAYIAMELIEGHDLKRYCARAQMLPLEKTLEYVAQVADALAYAHRQGVVHRDIKPPNIMLLKDGTLRITDFGIARIQAASKTATGAVLGTPAYMSPEQVNGKKVDGRADIFSLAVTLFELMTGEKPFAADSIAALLYRIANVDHSDPREFNKSIPDAVIPIINKALAKDPGLRYQTADLMAADLRNCLQKMKGTSTGGDSSAVGAAPTEATRPTPTETDVSAAPKTKPAPSAEPFVAPEKRRDMAPPPIDLEPKRPAPPPIESADTRPPESPIRKESAAGLSAQEETDVSAEHAGDAVSDAAAAPVGEAVRPEFSGVTFTPPTEPLPAAPEPAEPSEKDAPKSAPSEPSSSLAESNFLEELQQVLGPYAGENGEAPPTPEPNGLNLSDDRDDAHSSGFFGNPGVPSETGSALPADDPSEKTTILPPPEDEKTVAIDPPRKNDIPLVDGIEGTYQPPKKGGAGADPS